MGSILHFKQLIPKGLRLLDRILVRYNLKKITWKKNEYFNDLWKERIQVMSQYISPNTEVIDLGCGPMWLKDMIQLKKYYPVDYIDRGKDCIICDFNKHQFPDIKADIAFVSGALEYVEYVEWFIKNITQNTNRCIISYYTIEEWPDIIVRKQWAWVNNLTKDELIAVFKKNNFHLSKYVHELNKYPIFIFDKLQ